MWFVVLGGSCCFGFLLRCDSPLVTRMDLKKTTYKGFFLSKSSLFTKDVVLISDEEKNVKD